MLTAEMLVPDTTFDRVLLPYKQALEKLGIRMSIRVVDAPQYVERVKTFDFDMIIDSFPQTHAPGNDQREYWGSEAAAKPASRNTMGIRNPGGRSPHRADHLRACARGRGGGDPGARPRAVVEPLSGSAMVSAE